MLSYPQLNPNLQVEVIQPDRVFWLGEDQTFVLEDPLVVQLIPYLDGSYSLDQIWLALQAQVPLEQVVFRILELEQAGYVVEAERSSAVTVSLPDPLRVSLQIVEPLQTDRRAEVWLEVLRQRLAQAEVISTSTAAADLSVVITDDYLRPDLERVNQKALETGQAWMLVKPLGQVIWMGPILQPHQTGCWQCLRHRLQDQRMVESFLQHQRAQIVTRPWQPHPLLQSLGIHWLLLALHRWAALGSTHPQDHPLWGQLLTWDRNALSPQSHALTQRPQCPACGDPQLRDPQRSPQPWAPASATGAMPLYSSRDRIYGSPELTFERYRHHIDPLLGVVTQIQTLPPQDHPLIHNTRVIHPFPVRADLETLRENLQGRSLGKGRSAAEARTRGLCEALERYCGLFQGDEIRRWGCYADLQPEAIAPNQVLLFSSDQYQRRQQLNREQPDPRYHIPAPLDPQEPMEWSPLWSLTQQRFQYLPTAHCYYGYPDRRYGQADSNGCAAGATLEEAILGGFLELVERDGVALWWYNRLPKPAIDLTRSSDPYIPALWEDYTQAGWQLWALDLTTDLQIPICVAVAAPQEPGRPGFFCGFGAHFDPDIALLQALTELNQVRVNSPSPPAALTPQIDPAAPWWHQVTLEDLPWLRPDVNFSAETVKDSLHRLSPSGPGDILSCIERAAQRGLEILVLDQTRPDIGLPVVRVVVPGLRHFWRRLAPGRLYTLPVCLGWLSAPLSEAQLNPYSLSF